MDAGEVGSGMVAGAWGYVTIVYVSTWLVVVGLSVRAFLTARAARDSGGSA